MAAANEKFINLTVSNSAKVPIQILVQDSISGKTDAQNAVVAPSKSTSSKAKLDAKGIADFFINVRFVDEKKGLYYRCPAAMYFESDCPLSYVTGAKIERLRDLKKELPGAGNNRRKYLSAMFGWAVEVGHMTANPARDVRRVKYATDGFRTWTVAEVAQFIERHPIGTKPYLALCLLLFTGMRSGDIVKLGRQHTRRGLLRIAPGKTKHIRTDVSEKPILPPLARAIEAGPAT
jgi:integrase